MKKKDKRSRIWHIHIKPFFSSDNQIWDKVKDIIWWIRGEEQYWKDAEPCKRRLCRFCGNKPTNHITR